MLDEIWVYVELRNGQATPAEREAVGDGHSSVKLTPIRCWR
jgi:hypothetical protein